MDKELHNVASTGSAAEERIDELVELLNKASDSYYGGGDEIMSNFEWDEAFDELKQLEDETGIVRANSPTVNVSDSSSNSNREPHEYPALSLAKTKSVDELKKWAGERKIWLSWKLDGLTLVLTYDGGTLSKIVTRGSGVAGKNITALKNAIRNIPLEIEYKGHMVIRGEATISYTDFDMINATMEDDYKYANPRNLASGTLSLDDPAEVKKRRVSFNAFTLVALDDDEIKLGEELFDMNSWGRRMDALGSMGFVVVEREELFADGVDDAIARWSDKVDSGQMDIPVDGLVICYDDIVYASGGSVTGHHATRAGLAFKWQDVSALSTLREIEWSAAASTISPVAIFEPVQLEGTTVSRASLCNISEMERLGIGDGCTVEVIKANKIIPKVISVKESSRVFVIPDKCPVCHAPTEVRVSAFSGTKTLHCINPDCSAKRVKNFTRFVSKQGMDIDGLSIQTILKFVNLGFIHSFADIYRLDAHYDAIKEMEGFGEKSVENLKTAIDGSRSVKAVNFIYALCIPMIGIDAAKKIVEAIGFDAFLKQLETGESFEEIDGIGPERSANALAWYEKCDKSEFEALLEFVNITDGEAKDNSEGSLFGLTFVITGDVHSFKNRSEFKAYVDSCGGKVAGSVSKKTAYLVNNDVESTSSKNVKARELGIPIISEDEFITMFGKGE